MKHSLMAVLGMLVGLCVGRAAGAEEGLPPGFDVQRHMRISEVKDGMKGYGLSVFKGTKIERFEVEVISVLRNFNPKHDIVLIRCKGPYLEHTGSIAGMSGSPIYLMDESGRSRMIGAFAYGWPMMKDPLAGVQPIEYMLAIPAAGPDAAKTPATQPSAGSVSTGTPNRWSMAEVLNLPGANPGNASPGSLAVTRLAVDKPWHLAHATIEEMGGETRLRPLATPVMVSGIPRDVVNQFEPAFAADGMVMLQAGGFAGDGRQFPAAELEPGSAVAVPLMSGDADAVSIGTVTEVVGDRVLAFGHAFFGEGEISLPMGSGYIHTVIPSLVNSFKIGSFTQLRGTVRMDQLTGIAGQLGATPLTVPIELRCTYTDNSFDRTYRFSAVRHPRFTPMLSAMATNTAVASCRDLPQYHTLDYDLTLEFANGQVVHIQNRTANSSASELARDVAQPIRAAADNPFERVMLKKLSGVIKVSREARLAEILSVSLPRTTYRPGETLKAFVTYRPFRGAEAILPVEFTLPRDLPDGPYDFAVLDHQQHLADEQASRPFRFTAESVADVFAVLRDFTAVRHDAIYLRLLRQPDGVAVGRTAMPRLPSSRRRVLLGAGLSNTTVFVSSTVKSVATDCVMTGRANFTILIDKDGKLDLANGRGRQPVGGGAVPKAAIFGGDLNMD